MFGAYDKHDVTDCRAYDPYCYLNVMTGSTMFTYYMTGSTMFTYYMMGSTMFTYYKQHICFFYLTPLVKNPVDVGIEFILLVGTLFAMSLSTESTWV